MKVKVLCEVSQGVKVKRVGCGGMGHTHRLKDKILPPYICQARVLTAGAACSRLENV